MGNSGAPAASFGQSLSLVATLRSSAGLGSSLAVGTIQLGMIQIPARRAAVNVASCDALVVPLHLEGVADIQLFCCQGHQISIDFVYLDIFSIFVSRCLKKLEMKYELLYSTVYLSICKYHSVIFDLEVHIPFVQPPGCHWSCGDQASEATAAFGANISHCL